MKRPFAPLALIAALSVCLATWALPAAAGARDEAVVKSEILATGTGAEAVAHARITVHYTGWLADGTKFDSSRDREQPFQFTLGMGQVIPGWEKGILGMREGGKRMLEIPPILAYGKRGAGGVIPPNATLKFEVELIKVETPRYRNVDVRELQDLIDLGVAVIDVRTKGEWAQTGVVKGSHLITAFDDRRNFVPEFDALLDKVAGKNDEVVFICRSGVRSAAIADYLTSRRDFTNVVNVSGGMNAWARKGYPVVKP